MNKYEIYSNAKINTGLNIYNKCEDGYHTIDTIMIPIDLEDKLEIEVFDEEGNLIITCSNKKIPTDDRNILYKTYEKFFEKINRNAIKISVDLEKKIPSEAGLGGGSSNAAAFLKFLNEYYNNYFNEEELIEIAFSIGSDVPFFLENYCARISGKGDTVELLRNNLDTSLIIIKPDFGVSTKKAYEKFDDLEKVEYSNLNNVEMAIVRNDILSLENNILNNLEEALKDENDIKMLKVSLKSIVRNKKFFMSGSGSAFYTFVSKSELTFIETRLRTFLDNVKIFTCNIKK